MDCFVFNLEAWKKLKYGVICEMYNIEDSFCRYSVARKKCKEEPGVGIVLPT